MSERTRLALRPLDPGSVGPRSVLAPRGGNNDIDAGEETEMKRQRLSCMQTPVATGSMAFSLHTPSTASGMPPPSQSGHGDILDYLKGRGGRVKDLEDEVARGRSTYERAQHEVVQKAEQIARLQLELRCVAHAAPPAPEQRGGMGLQELAELEGLLDAELAKSHKLASDLASARNRESRALARAAEVEGAVNGVELECRRQVQEVQLQVLAARQEAKDSELVWMDKVRAAELAEKLERRKRETDQDTHRAVQRQLQEMRSELASKESAIGQLRTKVTQMSEALLKAELLAHSQDAAAAAAPLLARIQHLEEQLRVRDKEVETMRSALPPHGARSIGGGTAAAAAVLQGDASANAGGLVGVVRRLEAELQELQQSVGDKNEALVQLRVETDAAELGRAAAEEATRGAREAFQRVQGSEQSLTCKVAALTAERDSLRRSLAVPPGGGLLAGSVSGKLIAAEQAVRVSELEAATVELRARVVELEDQIAKAVAESAQERQDASEAKEHARVANIKVARLEKEADSLARNVAKLQDKVGSGQMDKSSMRVLHLKMNPESELSRSTADAEVQELRAENKVLREHLQAAETSQHGGSGTAAAGSEGSGAGSVSIAVKEAEIAVLRHRLSELEKSMVRLKEVTKERIMAFREACYCLFGYRVDMTSEVTPAKDAAKAPTTFSLKPQHADDPSAMLVFRFTHERGMVLVPTPFSTRLGREVDTFVRKFNCIPALTANLTMENFQKQTMC